MLKLTTRLFERNQNVAYADYYERALYNHLLATMAPDSGAMTYFLPLHGNFRTYLNGTHCCVGSGIENAPRYGEGIDFEQNNSLWVNLHIPSELNWRGAGMVLHQAGDITSGGPMRFTIVKAGGSSATLNFRIPSWISGPATIALNGKQPDQVAKPSSYFSLKREWKAGDVITLTLPASLRLERAKDNASMVSIFFGPVLLAGELGRESMPKDFADKDAYLKTPAVTVPDIVNVSANPSDWLQPIPNDKLAFTTRNAGPANGTAFTFV